MSKNILLLFLLFAGSARVHAQSFTEDFFAANHPKNTGQVLDFLKTPDVLVLRGQATIRNYNHTDYLCGVDAQGTVIWNSYDWPVDTAALLTFRSMVAGKDSFLYAAASEGDQSYVWKATLSSGKVAWKAPVPAGYTAIKLLERVPGELALLAKKNDISNTIYVVMRFSSADGALLGAYPNPAKSDFFGVDLVGNLYSLNKDTLIKVNGSNPQQVMYQTKMVLPPSGNEKVQDLSVCWPSPNGQTLLLYGSITNDDGLYARVDVGTGFVHPQSAKTLTEELVRDVAVRGDTVFTCWQHRYFGGSTFYFSLHAVRISTGQVVYQKLYTVNKPGDNKPSNYSDNASVSLDIDKNGNIYMTGRCSGDDYSGWCVVKIRASDGTKIWDRVLDDTPPDYSDGYAMGRAVWCPGGNKVLVAGNLQLYPTYQPLKPAVFELDPADGQPVNRTPLNGNYQYPSAAMQILNDANGYTVAKQLDNCLAVLRYDNAGALVWETEFCDIQYLEFSGLYPGKNQTLFLTARDKVSITNLNYLDNDGLQVYRISLSNGKTLGHTAVPHNYNDFFPLHLTAESDTAVFIYYENKVRKYVKIVNDNIAGQPVQIVDGNYEEAPLKAPRHLFAQTGGKTMYLHAKSKYYLISPSNGPSSFNLPVTPLYLYGEAIVAVPNSADILVAGGYPPEWRVARLTPGQPVGIWGKKGATGVISRLAIGSDGYFYTAGTKDDKIYLKKMAVADGQLIWEKTLTVPPGTAEINDMTVDEANGGVALAAVLSVPGNQRRAWLLKLDADGNTVFSIEKEGDSPGFWNSAICIGHGAGGQLRAGGQLQKAGLGNQRRAWLLKLDADGDTVFSIEKEGDSPGFWNSAICIGHGAGGQLLAGGQLQKAGLGNAGVLWGLPTQFHSVSGTVYVDQNDNGIFDPGENIWRQTVSLKPGNYVRFPDSTGRYQLYSPAAGTFNASIRSPSPWYEAVPANITFTGTQSQVKDAHIRVRPKSNVYDVAVQLADINPLRFGFTKLFLLTAENPGTLPADSCRVSLDCGPHFDIYNLLPAIGLGPALYNQTPGQGFSVSLGAMQPLAVEHFVVAGRLNTFLVPGDSLRCVAELVLYPGSDARQDNNLDTLFSAVTGAYDPNDLTAYPEGPVLSTELAPDGSLDIRYRVRFENTGNASTEFIRVDLDFDPLLDRPTFQLGASSAPCNVEFQGGNRVQISFPEYRLPPLSQDSLAAQGFVFFNLKTKPGLKAGDYIESQAAIYFDFNPPIITNVAETYILDPTSVKDPGSNQPLIRVYPNPVKAGTRILVSGTVGDAAEPVLLFDMQGQLLRRGSTGSGVDTNGLAAGVYQLWCAGKSTWVVVQ